MTLSCKQGDLAIIVSSNAGNEGKIVRCVEYAGILERVQDVSGKPHPFRGGARPVWRIDRTINFSNGFYVVQIEYCSDEKLRPLRGDVTDDDVEHTFSINQGETA